METVGFRGSRGDITSGGT